MNIDSLPDIVRLALAEDLGSGDVTTSLTVPALAPCRAVLLAKASGVLSGMHIFWTIFRTLDANVSVVRACQDGSRFGTGDALAEFHAAARPLLSGERTALNFVQRLSGVATATAAYVDAVKGWPTRICDTRKTTPGMRLLEKEAVRHGGGSNHRMGLFDGVLIKENHIAAAGGVAAAVKLARAGAHHLLEVEVEVRNLEELGQALDAGARMVLLDNMELETLREAVKLAKSRNART